MKKIFIVLVMILIVFSIGAVDIGGSTAAAGITGEAYQKIAIDQEFDIDIAALHIDVNGGYDIDVELDAKVWDYEIGGTYTLANFVFGSKITGLTDIELDTSRSFIDFAYENIACAVMVLLSFNEEKDQFQGAEFSAVYTVGPAAITVGYLLTDCGAEVDGVAPSVPPEGGVYAKVKITY